MDVLIVSERGELVEVVTADHEDTCCDGTCRVHKFDKMDRTLSSKSDVPKGAEALAQLNARSVAQKFYGARCTSVREAFFTILFIAAMIRCVSAVFLLTLIGLAAPMGGHGVHEFPVSMQTSHEGVPAYATSVNTTNTVGSVNGLLVSERIVDLEFINSASSVGRSDNVRRLLKSNSKREKVHAATVAADEKTVVSGWNRNETVAGKEFTGVGTDTLPLVVNVNEEKMGKEFLKMKKTTVGTNIEEPTTQGRHGNQESGVGGGIEPHVSAGASSSGNKDSVTGQFSPRRCSPFEDLQITSLESRLLPTGIPVFEVTVANVALDCAMRDIHITCGDWSSAVAVDPTIFRRLDVNDCVILDGGPLQPLAQIFFQYATSFEYPMIVKSARCVCS